MANQEPSTSTGGNIVIIGPRSSGKTTYLAGLAYWSQRKKAIKKNQSFTINPLNDDAKSLQDKAAKIIVKGSKEKRSNTEKKSLGATKILPEGMTIDEIDEGLVNELQQLPNYLFSIEITSNYGQKESILLNAKDYAGELFDDHLNFENAHSLYQSIWQTSLAGDVEGSLILLSGWQDEDDEKYSELLGKFIEKMDQNERTNNYRLAVAMSKCERGELWPGRIEPEVDIFSEHLPRTKSVLQDKVPQKNLRFYAVSTFGVLGEKDPRPNRKDIRLNPKDLEEEANDEDLETEDIFQQLETQDNSQKSEREEAALRDPNKWQPYNLISPLYWLSTGKNMRSDV